MRSSLVNALYGAGTTSLADIGIQTDRYGKLTFDSDKFDTALKADAGAVAERFTATGAAGFANRVQTVATAASAAYTGTLTTSITGRSAGITSLQKSIDDWTDRLELRRTTMTRQFTAMETALSKMQSQSSWLSAQISSLSSNSSSN